MTFRLTHYAITARTGQKNNWTNVNGDTQSLLQYYSRKTNELQDLSLGFIAVEYTMKELAEPLQYVAI